MPVFARIKSLIIYYCEVLPEAGMRAQGEPAAARKAKRHVDFC